MVICDVYAEIDTVCLEMLVKTKFERQTIANIKFVCRTSILVLKTTNLIDLTSHENAYHGCIMI